MACGLEDEKRRVRFLKGPVEAAMWTWRPGAEGEGHLFI